MNVQDNLLIVTGLSGAGMSSALKDLEDLGYEVFDNFPPSLVDPLLSEEQSRNRAIAIGIDTRARSFDPESVREMVKRLQARLIFITADEAILQRRFTETRRKHPLGPNSLDALCKRLGVTTGSFYHSFDSWQDFTDALLQNWLRSRTQRFAEIARQDPDPVKRLQMLISNVSEFNHRAEAAIRVWAGVDDRVAAIQREVDEGRYQAAHEALVSIVGPDLAPAFAVWGLSTAVGYEMLSDLHPAEHLHWALEQVLQQVLQNARTTAPD